MFQRLRVFDRFLFNAAQSRLEATAFDWFDADATFEKLSGDIDRVASALFRLRDLKPDLVGLRCQNPYQHWVFVLSLARIGLASASLPHVVDANFVRALTALRPDVLITDCDDGAAVGGRQWLVLNEMWFRNVCETGERLARAVAVKPDDVARVALAGAADATPQRISMTYRYVEIAVFHLLYHDIMAHARGQAGYRVIPTLGAETPSGFLVIIAALTAGSCVQIATAAQLGAAFSQKTPCVAIVSPSQAEFILSQLPPGMQPLTHFYLTVAGGRLSTALCNRLRQSLTPNVQVVYGSDECGPVAFGDPATLGDEAAVGHVVPWITLEVVDADDAPCPANVEGEVRLMGTGVIGRYDDNFSLTEKKFRNGWFYPGDRGSVDAHGVLKLSGRSDDLISFGGDKFDLRAIDAHILECPGVRDCAVFAVPDENGKPEPWAALVTESCFQTGLLATRLRDEFPNLPLVRTVRIEKMPRDDGGAPDRQALLVAVKAV
ncbi:AMP-dependent synthetase and ligase [Acetobacter nitrogenifigens DSM 23921 = NBRC 105050]|nr:AMP-dependent synthetase and ligase [Acetobacter nitrogenifigens DSM 23921 = NBRC 105050]